MGEETTTYADGGGETRTGDTLGHRKLRVDSRKWVLSRMAPKRYGEKISQEISGPCGGPVRQSMEVTPEYAEQVRRIADIRSGMTPPAAYKPGEA